MVNRKFRAPAPNMLCPLVDTMYQLPGNRSATSPMSQPLPGNTCAACVRGGAGICLCCLRDRYLRKPRSALVSNQWRPMPHSAGKRRGLSRPTSFSPLGRFALQVACRATDALEQALYARRPAHQGGLIHHSDRGGQYVSIRYTERLGKAGI